MKTRKIYHSIDTWKPKSTNGSPTFSQRRGRGGRSTSRGKSGKKGNLRSHRDSNLFSSSVDSADSSDFYNYQYRSIDRSPRDSKLSLKLLGLSFSDDKNNKSFKPRLSEKHKSRKGVRGNEMAPDNHDWLETPLFRHMVRGETEVQALKQTNVCQILYKKIHSKKEKIGKLINGQMNNEGEDTAVSDKDLIYYRERDDVLIN